MRILLDHCAPVQLIGLLTPQHQVIRALRAGLDRHLDKDLLSFAEQLGYDVVLTTDQSMYFQQNWRGRRITLVILEAQRWPIVRRYSRRISQAVDLAIPGTIIWIGMPKF